MQCAWPKFARPAVRGFARPLLNQHNRIGIHSASWPAFLRLTVPPKNPIRQLQRRYTALQTSPATSLPGTPPGPHQAGQFESPVLESAGEETYPDQIISSAEVGRTAAQAIRFSIQQDNLGAAFLIIQSWYHARHPNSPLHAQKMSFLGDPTGNLIPFGKSVTSRLPAHSLLHALIRNGEVEKASQLVQGMISMGTRVKSRSLEAALKGFENHASSSPPNNLSSLIPLKSLDSTLIRPHMSHNAHITGGALRILQAARRSGGRSTGRMYRYLIALCIINGEIILASLLFGVLLRDWQAREKAKAAAATAAATILSSEPSELPEYVAQAPAPQSQELKSMCNYISWNFSQPHVNDESSKLAFSASLQALANLANDMDEKRLSVNLEPLIVAMYNCPRTTQMVWVSQNSMPPRRVEAYTYFHDVLERLISSLPDREREQEQIRFINGPPKYNIPQPLEPVNHLTYNALLHYSLRHQRSIDSARFVLTNMLERLEDALRVRQIQAKKGMTSILDRAAKDFPSGEVEALMKEVGLTPVTLAELLNVPEGRPLNTYALSARIALLVSKGEIQTIIDALPTILPGLFPPPAPKGTPRVVAIRAANKWREDSLEKAVKLGPVVFTALLNALRKNGSTGLAESVFVYGLEAEKKSFDLDVSREKERAGTRRILVRPWCLPVHAYTTMIQAYDNERRRRSLQKPYAKGWGLTLEGTSRPGHTSDDGSDPVRRDVLARRMILETYHLMMAASQKIATRLKKLEELVQAGMKASLDGATKQKLDIKIVLGLGQGKNDFNPPEPDIWFFESLLDIF
ncbi:hypothetical protein BDN70DRAFT_585417 [Pholiota conissans]|uniref:Uncharacterized protein n=1 Tax=Pholiota conissans TaxID=109636 RepID=A0A9P6CVJ5_9AGAR|nr:hypothetical protein BDN70DRAFT_585417 [Pholiota conissans]